MKYTILYCFLAVSMISEAQLVSLVVRGDTLFSINPSTGVETQLTKFIPPMQSGKLISTNGTDYNWVTADKSLVGLSNVTNESKATMFTNASFTGTTSLGLATATSLTASQNIHTTGGSMGYLSGAGGSVVQSSSKSTAVTLNNICGRITMNGAALAAGAEVAFTLNNNTINSTDVIIVNVQSIGTAGAYLVGIGAVANGSCSITVSNASAGSLSQAIVLNYVVIKSSVN